MAQRCHRFAAVTSSRETFKPFSASSLLPSAVSKTTTTKESSPAGADPQVAPAMNERPALVYPPETRTMAYHVS
ncbi:hypothetical protein CGRA01v4_10356 [Colletotrichum graminicola]|uniref:Uncharacterized protein n=1 Tax=Colletotrichum graminicola (strain M1.001 / M2 / FGSC 10212) TaxID=645133 RepID=E3QDC6_COLGM|nr:uncharacterized protein GLRG_04042 [Colletotrichum graminicola M1.001]EFQ28898.1 hypothetical protein GLRG_04042 [Colletotrichum graminicola M1.001]WDK19069.1 hypothetical protein CGRA01v4_10356 [Colletotrichum graminicola]